MRLVTAYFFIVCLFPPFMGFSLQHPDRLISLKECEEKGDFVEYLLEEPDSRQFLLFLKNGVVVNEGKIVTSRGEVFQNTEVYLTHRHNLLNPKRNIANEDWVFFPGKLAVISSSGQENWYHWLFQVLPRLKILAQSGIEYDRIYLANLDHPWQKNSLKIFMEHFGLSERDFLFVNGDTIIKADLLIVPSVPFIPSKSPAFPSWLKACIRDAFLPKKWESTFPERLYISRRKACSRRIVQEETLLKALEKKGFVSICLEDLDPQEQAALFSFAKIIVGPHGSGFANLIFSHPGTVVVEIDHGSMDEPRSLYQDFARKLGCHYFGYYPDYVKEDAWDAKISIDIVKFLMFLDEHLLKG
ncbi:MAG: glycosyltransferase 61 family protein [Chlamydiota bacterium]